MTAAAVAAVPGREVAARTGRERTDAGPAVAAARPAPGADSIAAAPAAAGPKSAQEAETGADVGLRIWVGTERRPGGAAGAAGGRLRAEASSRWYPAVVASSERSQRESAAIGERQATSWRLAAKTEGAFHQQAGPHPGHRYCPAPAAGERLCVPSLQRNIGGLLAIAGLRGSRCVLCRRRAVDRLVRTAVSSCRKLAGGENRQIVNLRQTGNQHPKKHGDREVEGCAFLSRLTVWQDCESGEQSVAVFVPEATLV